jgi:sulfofructose kinase
MRASEIAEGITMTRIACVGITVLDRIWYLDELPKEGGKYVAKDYTEVGGGPAATAAVAAAKLGAKVDFIGRVGDDDTGARLLTELESLGVNTRYTRIIKGARSSQSAVLVDASGERVIANYPSPDLPAEADWLQDIDFSQWDIVLADVRWHDGAKQAFTLARLQGLQTLLDADVTPQDIAELIALSDHAAFSAPGLRRLTQMDNPIDALKKAQTLTNGQIYVTQGREGCYWLEKNELCHQQGFAVDVVDTTGAGDVFHGALAVSLGKQESSRDAVRFASAVAALKCTKPGGRAGIPDCDQTRSFLSLFV